MTHSKLIPTEQDYQYCQDKAAKSGSSFYYSFRFLPADRRKAITALYAFCREVDDVVDDCSDMGVAAQTLEWWRAEIHALYKGEAQHPVTRALSLAIHDYSLPEILFFDIIDGMKMDVSQHRYLDFASLEVYCYRAAGAVGLLAARIFGYTHSDTLEYAKALGTALQLTNILRDIGEDARRGRLYLPLDELQKYHLHVHDIMQGKAGPEFEAFYLNQIERAEHYYKQAFAFLPQVDRKAQRPGLIMGYIYYALLQELRNEGRAVFKQRIALTPLRKLWIAWKTWYRYA